MRTRFALVVGLLVCYVGVASAQVREEWVARHDGFKSQEDGARDIALDTLGNIYVTGAICTYHDDWDSVSGSCIDSGWETLKYDADGNKLWSAYYDERWAFWRNGAGVVAVDNAGNVYVTGSLCVAAAWDEISGFCWETKYTTIKYDTNGNQRWVARYGGPVNDWNFAGAVAIVVDGAGNVYVTGSSLGVDTSYDYATIKYDTDGHELWVARYNGLANGDDGGAAIALDAVDNSVYVTGTSVGSGSSDYATIKYDRDGNELWVARYNGPGNGDDWTAAIVLDGSRDVYVTGASLGVGASTDYATVKYDTHGDELWVVRYDGPGNSFDGANALTVDASGVYVSGTSWGAGTSADYATIKYDSDGNERWVARYNGPGNGDDWTAAIVLDVSGNVYVTGQSPGAVTSSDYATIRYDNDGNELWVARYDGHGNRDDYAAAIVLDARSNVYITGVSWAGDTQYDYATIKYSQTSEPGDPDADRDGWPDTVDNCPVSSNPNQADADADGFGDACDPTITFVTAPTPTYLGGNFTVGATTTNTDSSALSYSVVGGLCAVVDASAGTFRATAAGTCRVEANGVATANFVAASAQEDVIIAKAAVTVTLSHLIQTYTSTPLTPTASVAAGLVIVWTNAPQTNAGSYAVTATVNDRDYQGTAGGTFIIQKAAATVTLSNLTQTYTGSPLTPTAATVPSGLAVLWTNAPQTNAGSYEVTATVNDPNYQGAASDTLVINPPASVLSVKVESPNGGERLLKGVRVTIRWTATGTAGPNPFWFDVALSRNGGSTFSNIADCTNLSGALQSCSWTPSNPSSEARIRVIARDSSGVSVADTSDGSFSIVAR